METSVVDWVATVAERASADNDVVKDALTRYGIVGPMPVPPRRRLRVDAIQFAGVKNLADERDIETRRFVPFSFYRAFTTPVTAFVSDGKNDSGKSSTLDILKWGLRGSSKVAGDVQKWLRQVCLLLAISDERILVAWRVDDGVPRGQILVLPDAVGLVLKDFSSETADVMAEHSREAAAAGEPIFTLDVPVDGLVGSLLGDGAFIIGRFDGHDEMATVVGDLMLQRLGLDALTQWTGVTGATDADDGNLVGHGWPLWSQALAITKPSEPAVIGETPFQAQNVLNTFLATEWSATRVAARAQKNAVAAQLAGITRRRHRDSESRQAILEALRAQHAEAEAELSSIPISGMTDEELQAAMTDIATATDSITQTQRAIADAALAYGSAERDLGLAEQDLAAFREAAVTKRFWHALKPLCCPRCDAKVQPEQWQREREGSCSLCNSDLDVAGTVAEPTYGDEVDDNSDPVTLAEQRVLQLEADAKRFSALHDAAMDQAKIARVEFERASTVIREFHGNPVERRALERRIAVLDGRIQERSQTSEVDMDEVALSNDRKILEAVEAFAGASAKSDFSEALSAVSAQITTLGRTLGISNLEKATLQANAHLPVVKGGEKTAFGRLTDGEKLRLKIALVVSLLDVGTTSGLGRHPGLLIVDSLATEELNREDGESLLRELERVAETYRLQVITSTAHSDLVAAVLPAEAVQRPTAENLMW